LASADKQTATIDESDGPGSDVVAELTVYEAGRYRRTPERGDEPVEVDGHAGFFGEGPSSFGRTPVPTVEWEYRPGAWAVLSGVKEPAWTRKQLLAIAADVRLGEPYEARTPCRFGYLPAGLRAVSVSGAPTRQDAPPAHYQPFLRFVDDVPGDLDAWSMDADLTDGAAIEVVFWAVGPVNGEAGQDSATEDVGGYPGNWTDQLGTRTAFVYLPGTIIVRVKVDARHLDAYPKSEIAHIVRELHCAPPQDLPSWPTVTEAVGR